MDATTCRAPASSDFSHDFEPVSSFPKPKRPAAPLLPDRSRAGGCGGWAAADPSPLSPTCEPGAAASGCGAAAGGVGDGARTPMEKASTTGRPADLRTPTASARGSFDTSTSPMCVSRCPTRTPRLPRPPSPSATRTTQRESSMLMPNDAPANSTVRGRRSGDDIEVGAMRGVTHGPSGRTVAHDTGDSEPAPTPGRTK